jgi:DNA-binding transcriptional LysR family regulator
VALYTLKDFIPQLLSDNLGLEIQFTHDLSRRIAESVISGDLDFGLVINPVSHPDLRIQNLLTDEVTLFQSKKRRLPGCESTLFLDPDLHQSQKVLSRLARHGKPLRLVSTSSLEVIAELTKQGCGLGLLPSRVALPQGLEPLSDSAPRVKDTLALIYRPERQRSGASTAFKQAVVGALAAR